MTWFVDQRMEWIAETLRVFGFINRSHIERKFGVSTPQASTDLQEFQRRYPGVAQYDTKAKGYVAVADPSSYAVGRAMRKFNERLREVRESQ